jgi:hypothetical protein
MRTFEITIQRRTESSWPVVVEESEAGIFLPVRTEGVLDLDSDALDGAGPCEYGAILGRALFRDAVLVAFTAAAARSGDQLRVLLAIEDETARKLRWERLCRPVGGKWLPLALDQRIAFSQYLRSRTDRRYPLIGRADLRMLVLVARPAGLESFGLEPFDEAQAIEAVRSALGDRIRWDLLGSAPGALGPPTLDELCMRLTGERYTLLHIVCHGAYPKHFRHGRPAVDRNETVVYLSDPKGRLKPVPATELIGRLGLVAGARGLPHFTFLSSCEGAVPDAEGVLGGLGQRLVRELGMPAVLAMTDRITIDTAHALARAFYEHLLDHGEVDRALTEALAGLASRPDVAIPVPALFGRLGDQPLFRGHGRLGLRRGRERRAGRRPRNGSDVVGTPRADSYEWRTHEPWRLVECVVADAHEWLPEVDPFADAEYFHTGIAGRRALVGRIYDRLCAVGIHYDSEPPSETDGRQWVRTISRLFRREARGTGLDLALAFCGLCEGCGLIPCVFLLAGGHTLAGVWLAHHLRDWNAGALVDTLGRAKWNRLVGGSGELKAEDAREVLEFIRAGQVVAVECSGFARGLRFPPDVPEGVGRNQEGLLDFNRAADAGAEQLERAVAAGPVPVRRLRHAIDIAVGRNDPRYEFAPLAIGSPPPKVGAPPAPPGPKAGVWPYRVDRQDQAEDIQDAVRDARESRRPPVCLVVGSIDDDHPGLVRRAVGHDLVVRGGPPPKDVFIDFPGLDRAVPGAGFEAAYLSGLDRKLPGSCATVEELVRFLRRDQRRWVITSMVWLSPDDPRIGPLVASLAAFWSKVGAGLGEVPPARLPVAWLQVVPRDELPPRSWLPWVKPPEPKVQLHQRMNRVSGVRCFRLLGPVARLHLEAWRQHLHDATRESPHLAGVDPAPVIKELFPVPHATQPMQKVSERLLRLIEGPSKDSS